MESDPIDLDGLAGRIRTARGSQCDQGSTGSDDADCGLSSVGKQNVFGLVRGEIMDPEIVAMTKMSEALEGLDTIARSRVLRWAADKYEVTLAHKVKKQEDANDTSTGTDERVSQEYETFAELFSDAGPSTSADKVLLAGYWHQVVLGQSDVNSAALNKDLKDLGHGVTGINERFDSLMSAKPQLAIQLKKSGLSKQARKKYKITKAGIARVREMLEK